jgi:16S rRNA processing protein RimM
MVTLTTNQYERAEPGTEWYAGEQTLVVESARRHQGRFLVRFVGVDSRDAAEALRGVVVSAAPLGDAPEGEWWVHDLIGCSVIDRAGIARGRVVAVEANPAHDLLVLDGGDLVPLTFVVEQHGDVLVVDVPPGLFAGDPEP